MSPLMLIFFFFNDTATTEIYTLSLHDALPISDVWAIGECAGSPHFTHASVDDFRIIMDNLAGCVREVWAPRSEEHTSELQSPCNLVCRLLLEKKKKKRSYVQRM